MTTDILDYIDDLDFDDDDETVKTVDVQDDESFDIDYQMTRQEAEEITETIKSSMQVTYVLLVQAHENKAHKALGYNTWAEYVKDQFDISAQRSYQLMDLSKIVNEIESVAPEGTKVKLTEAQARDIKRELPRITEQIIEETEGQDPDQAAGTINRIVDEAREQQKADEDVLKKREQEQKEAEEEGYRKGLEAAADAILEDEEARKTRPDAPANMTDTADGDFVEVDVEGEYGLSQNDKMALYNFFSVLKIFPNLPDPENIIALLTKDNIPDVELDLQEAISWMNNFKILWDDRDF